MTTGQELPAVVSVTHPPAPARVQDGVDPAAGAAGAAEAAEGAASAAGVRIREIAGLDDVEAVARLYDGIWRRDENPPISRELLRALAKAGNYVAGAYRQDELVGACVGFFSAPADATLHSHITGVSAAARSRSVGFALKLHQRAWALRHGLSVVAWTFDPLVARNAHVNLGKLGARPVEYLPNFYGAMRDSVNGDDDSDRLLVRWALTGAGVEAACAGTGTAEDAGAELARGALVALGASAGGAPVPGRLDAATCLVAVPPDVEGLRADDPGLAREWRGAVREVLGGLMADGARVTGFDRAGWYVVRRAGAPPVAPVAPMRRRGVL